jgi:hypothetical protein
MIDVKFVDNVTSPAVISGRLVRWAMGHVVILRQDPKRPNITVVDTIQFGQKVVVLRAFD